MAIENTTPERIEELVGKQRAFFATGTTRDIEWRRSQLRQFQEGLQKFFLDQSSEEMTRPLPMSVSFSRSSITSGLGSSLRR